MKEQVITKKWALVLDVYTYTETLFQVLEYTDLNKALKSFNLWTDFYERNLSEDENIYKDEFNVDGSEDNGEYTYAYVKIDSTDEKMNERAHIYLRQIEIGA